MIDNPNEWIITKKGDFIRLKDSLKSVDKKLEAIREHLKKPFQGKIRFTKKTPEQISKERYDKVWEEVNFDYERLHDWLYDEKNKDKVEMFKLEGRDFSEAIEAIFNYVKSSRQKWRIRWGAWRNEGEGREIKSLINEETGQIIYYNSSIKGKVSDLYWEEPREHSGERPTLIDFPEQKGQKYEKGKYVCSSVLIFLHGTYGAGSLDQMVEKFPGLKVIHPHSPTLQYDMWHGSRPARRAMQRLN